MSKEKIEVGDVVQVVSGPRSEHGLIAVVVGIEECRICYLKNWKRSDFDQVDLEWIGDYVSEDKIQQTCAVRHELTYIGKAAVRPSTGEPFDVEAT